MPAGLPAAEKSGYDLFHRTPEAQLRELTTDRPDLTESPYTVDAGWWQIETDAISYTRDHDTAGGADAVNTVVSLGTVNLKVGLTHNIDLQTVIETYAYAHTEDRNTGAQARVSGFGDVTTRVKINLHGNDGGPSAMAIMPFIKWPTNRHGLGNRSIEGGLIVPFAHSLPGGWSLGAMTELDLVRNDTDDGYAAAWVNTITFGHDLTGRLAGYLELATVLQRGADIVTFDCGLTYGIGRHVQLDCGMNLGLTPAADDLTVFAGLSVRY
jgi:hypothetical protein